MIVKGDKALFDVYDGTSTITCKAFVEKAKLKDYIKKIDGKGVKIDGVAKYDNFAKEITVMANSIFESEGLKKQKREDNAENKRVELHMHTQMSQMDGITPCESLVKRAISWGWNAVAITDHGVVQSFPDAHKLLEKTKAPIKVIYGVEAYFAPDKDPCVSNSAGSKTYTLSIIRQTQDSEVIPNTIEGEEPENNSEGIGLTGLRITGYTFEEEFQTGTYEYTVKIPEGLSESKLEEIKNSITAITNDDKVSVEIQTTLNEDGSAVITLVVKDDEKEYSTYKINFIIDKEAVNNESSEKSEKTSAVAGTTKTNNSQGKTAVEEITRKMLILLICMVAIILIAVYYAINSYIKSKHSPKDKKDYFNDDEYEDQNNLISSIYAETNGKPLDYKKLTNSDEDKIEENKDMKSRISEMLKDDNKIPEFSGASENKDEIENKKSSIFDEEEKSENIGGYRKPRRGFG